MAGGKGGGGGGGAGGTGYKGAYGQSGGSNGGGGGGGGAGGGVGGQGGGASGGGSGGSTPGARGGIGVTGGGGAGGSNGYYGNGATLDVSGSEIVGGAGGDGGTGLSSSGPNGGPGGGGGAGGYGAVLFGTTIDNVRAITGGDGGAGGTSTTSGESGAGGDGGVGLAATAAGVSVTNESAGVVSGGSGGGSNGGYAGAGGAGISFRNAGAYLLNAGNIYGGSGGTGTGGTGTGGSGVSTYASSAKIVNTSTGKIMGGSSTQAGGGAGIFAVSGTVTNSGYVAGGAGVGINNGGISPTAAGAGVAASIIDNNGTIQGGQGGGAGALSVQTLTNEKAGAITGGSSTSGIGGTGSFAFGTVTNAGTIAGGAGGSRGGYGAFIEGVNTSTGQSTAQSATNNSTGVIKGGYSASGSGGDGVVVVGGAGSGGSSVESFTNAGTIAGGTSGGTGGTGVLAFNFSGSASITITNTGTIQGGTGHIGTSYVGSGGSGVTAFGATIINSGSITGGVGKGSVHANSVTFLGAKNTLALGADASFGGGGLALGGTVTLNGQTLSVPTATLTFDQSAGTGFSVDATLSAPITGAGGIIKVGAGKLTLQGDSSFSGGTIINGGTIEIGGSLGVGTGAVSFQASSGYTATLALENGAQPTPGGTFGTTLDSFGANDALDLEDFDSMGATVRYNASGQTITVSSNSGSETFKLSNVESGVTGFQAASDGSGGTRVTAIVCFASATLIRTSHGDVAVEALQVGDLVVTASGFSRPIRWLGHRAVDCRRHPHAHDVMPVRIAAHAFGTDKPARDLLVSPGHCICVDGQVLVPAMALVNGATVQQIEVATITYWHVELDSHDVILAENLPAESYLDMGNRAFFAESGVVAMNASPDVPPAGHTHADFCRPYYDGGPLVEAIRARMRKRAVALGWTLSETPDVHLEIDGCRIDPVVREQTMRFLVPGNARDVWIVSPASQPHDTLGAFDWRALGIAVTALSIDDGFAPRREIGAADARLATGFHPAEEGHRWTTGRARLPADLWAHCRDTFFLRLDLGGPPSARWLAPEPSEEAASKVA